MSKHRRPGDRRPGLVLAAFAVAGVTLLGASSPALAAKGGGGGRPGGSTTGNYSVVIDQSAPYVFGQAITVTTNVPTYPDGAGPYLWLKCYQGGALVLATDHAGFEGGWYNGDPFWLGPSQTWTGGAADCTLPVIHRSHSKVITDATTSFSVAAG